MGKLIGIVLRKAAEGDFGVKVQEAYWYTKGLKTWTGLVLEVLALVLTRAGDAGLCADCSTWSTYVASAGAFLLTIGFVDGGLHLDPPKLK